MACCPARRYLLGATLTLATLLAAPVVRANPTRPLAVTTEARSRPWTLLAEGGALIPFPSNDQTMRGTLGLAVGYVTWSRLEVELGLRLGLSHIATDLAPSVRVGLRFALGPLKLSAGLRLGYVAIHVDKGALGSLWTWALLINPGVDVCYRLTGRLELRGRLLGATIQYNQLWIVAWEPSLGLGWRF